MNERPAPAHEPVLVERIVDLLARPASRSPSNGVIVDATVGAGGHAAALLEATAPSVGLVGFDRDPDALDLARQRLGEYGERVTLVHAPYDEMGGLLAELAEGRPVLGVLYDLGVSSLQLDRPQRGFSFREDGPLDMRMDPGAPRSAADLLNEADEPDLARLIATYGEERFARRIARAIVRARPLESTQQLAALCETAVPAATRRAGLHPATRTFQALRIAVNVELDRLQASLPQALDLIVTSRGRCAVLSYHSLEDRIVKRFFAQAATGCICPPDLPVCGCGRSPAVRALTRGAEVASRSETQANPRARSAKLRAVEAIAPTASQIPGDSGPGLHDTQHEEEED